MANIKDLFKSSQFQKTLVSKSLNDICVSGVESPDFTQATIELQNKVEPDVDYSNPENFVFYGLAEQYYRDSFDYILNEFPYDGSGKEKTDWELQASTFDNYIYKTQYPRTNGYVRIGKGTTWTSGASHGYFVPSRQEYISFKGGPHPAPQIKSGERVSKFFPSRQNSTPSSNYYNVATNQQSNLEIDGDRGISVEFWINKQSYLYASESPRQVICDLWSSASWGESDYGRFRVELSGSPNTDTMPPAFYVELMSGSAGFSVNSGTPAGNTTVTLSGSSITGSWNHFALTFKNSGTKMEGKLYQNGKKVNTVVAGTSIGLVTGSILGQIGSLVTQVSGANGQRGYGLLSASLDEFRFWKKQRTSQEIGLNWFTQINGGTNTDFQYSYQAPTKYNFTNPVDLGVYYKFNEGITGRNSTDSTILDYSGRISNGAWNGYGSVVNQRTTGSAMVLAGASAFEYKDPILYSFDPLVSAKLETLASKGFEYDINNNASIYHSIPNWIIDEDGINGGNTLLKLTQLISNYFDRLQLQIKALPRLRDINYISSSAKPYPFVDRMIDSTGITALDLFTEASELEDLVSRDDFRLFSKKLEDTKNRIYKNIYNNLVHILKTKGTEKSFRNLVRCYGIGEELVKLNLYGDEVTFDIKENFESTITRKKYANFFHTASFDASVYQSASLADNGSQSYLSASTSIGGFGHTFEAEIFFPKRQEDASKDININVPFIASSLFGLHTVNSADPESLTWAPDDVANFQVSAVRSGGGNKDAYFKLDRTSGGAIPTLTSSLIKNVYDNTSWNLAVKLRPSTDPWAPLVSGSTTTNYDVEFVGYNTILDSVENSFKVSGTLSYLNGVNFMTSSKRIFLGAHRDNFTGDVREKCDARISSVRFWRDYLDDRTILAHAKDPSNFGRLHPGQNAFINQAPLPSYFGNATPIPQIETLALQWNFDQVTGSDASGEFIVKDYSSGSLANTANYGWIGAETQIRHPGKGIGFDENNADAAIREYVYTAKQQPPEVLNSSDMIEIKNEGDIEIYTKDTRPINYFFAVEKSMNAIISAEMLKIFATVLDFNNLIGEPVNRYRQDYKALGKIRQLFFEKVQNSTIDFEKFMDYYKWVDDSITKILTQIFPISANFSNQIFNVIESHVLERNKYWNKFPSLEMESPDLEAGLYGINEMLYPYKRGSAPIPNSLTSSNCVWWHDRASRTNTNITSSSPTVNTQRDTIRKADNWRPSASPPTITDISSGTPTQYQGSTYALRNFTKPFKFSVQEMPEIHGGANFPRGKKIDYAHASLKVGTSEQLNIAASSVAFEEHCTDIIEDNPTLKNRLESKLENSTDTEGYISGKTALLAPFSLFSSSVTTGYLSNVASNFRPKTEIANYHEDMYGEDKEIPLQGPFTERHVGGKQHRHININTSSTDTADTRPEAWNLSVASLTASLTSVPYHRPRAIYLRDEGAKRPVNIRNIQWGTASQAIGNYRFGYQVLQTSGRKLNNSFFVKNGGFVPVYSASAWVDGIIDYALPDYTKFGKNKNIFVERFNAPGGPDVSSRGVLDLYAEEYAIYNALPWRNLSVRDPLQKWQTEHCGQFGIQPVSGVTEGYRQPRTKNYGTLASYHKVNRNGKPKVFVNDDSREVEWSRLIGTYVSDYNRVLNGGGVAGPDDNQNSYWAHAQSDQPIRQAGYFEFEISEVDKILFAGLSHKYPVFHKHGPWYDYTLWINASNIAYPLEGNTSYLNSWQGVNVAVGDKLRILRETTKVSYQHVSGGNVNWTTFFTSPVSASGDYYPRAGFESTTETSIANPRISNPQYDNWFIQHPIPQTDLQYSWINHSYDRNKDQPLDHVGSPDRGRTSFSVPSGSTSVTASAIQFVTGASLWISEPDSSVTHTTPVAFNGMFTIVGIDYDGYSQNYVNQITSSTNTISPGYNFVNTTVSKDIPYYFLNLNGPYGYPSWKQIRTGETPVARHQRRNNIITVGPPRERNPKAALLKAATLVENRFQGQQGVTYFTRRTYQVMRTFIEPMVTFKYRPMETKVTGTYSPLWKVGVPIEPIGTLQHTFCNNLYYFANTDTGLTRAFGIPDAYNSSQGIMGNELRPLQIHDALHRLYEQNPFEHQGEQVRFEHLVYKENIFPREINTGLNKIRSRVNYAEADESGSPEYGSNGIDRNSTKRRTFWSNTWL